ncbi:MAG: hypothetical protein HY764_00105 [Candidatus Portnoybacteria bacterium]|nr:hypothetical protein [Candidatus Portnoybacteria bacterium]
MPSKEAELYISMRTIELYQNHEEIRKKGISPLAETHAYLKRVDPTFEKTLELFAPRYLKDEDDKAQT